MATEFEEGLCCFRGKVDVDRTASRSQMFWGRVGGSRREKSAGLRLKEALRL